MSSVALPCGCGPDRPCPRAARIFASGLTFPLRCHLEIGFTRSLGPALLDHLDASHRLLLTRIAEEYRVSPEEVISRDQALDIASARHAWWSALRDSGLTYPEIGCVTGHDHSTVHAGIRKHKRTAAGAAA